MITSLLVLLLAYRTLLVVLKRPVLPPSFPEVDLLIPECVGVSVGDTPCSRIQLQGCHHDAVFWVPGLPNARLTGTRRDACARDAETCGL